MWAVLIYSSVGSWFCLRETSAELSRRSDLANYQHLAMRAEVYLRHQRIQMDPRAPEPPEPGSTLV